MKIKQNKIVKRGDKKKEHKKFFYSIIDKLFYAEEGGTRVFIDELKKFKNIRNKAFY